MTRFKRLLISGLAIFLVWPSLITCGQEPAEPPQIQPPDVFVAVGLASNELELIRFVMGKPKSTQTEIDVSDAAPREVYFQALTMFRKADRLCFEHTRRYSDAPEIPPGDIQAADVFEVVNQTLMCIGRVKETLGIEEEAISPARDASKKPNDVFRAAVQVNRQLNMLLDHKFAPSDVFQQITSGIGYTSRLLEAFPDAPSVPDPPPFEKGKRPADVYRRLVENFARIRAIAELSGVTMLNLQVDEAKIQSAEPSDVYDIASLLVSELAFLHSSLDDAKPAYEVYFVGRKFPSHVYQRAGILERHLMELETRVRDNPKWLEK